MLTAIERIRFPWGACALGLALLLLAGAAKAQDIQVSSATPDTAEQGTLDLEVMVGGDNFPSDAWADFYVTGTCDYEADPNCVGDDGGITVKEVKRQGPKALKVTIDVAEDAQYQLRFDVLVRSRRGGRSGKGTELFGVTQKTNNGGQDTTPPGMPLDLQVLDVSFGSATLSWTMPADDGYDPASGSVAYCTISVDDPTGYPHWNCYPRHDDGGVLWLPPGETQVCWEQRMQPGKTYQLGVSCFGGGGWSPENQVEVSTQAFGDVQDLSWSIQELPFATGGLVGHGIDIHGRPIVAGVVVTGQSKGRWKTVTTAIRLATGVWDEGSGAWTWSYEDVDGFANRMLVDPAAGPVFAGLRALGKVGRSGGRYAYERQLEYTFHDGVEWTTEVAAADAGYSWGVPGFALDPAGAPAIAWCYESEGQPREMRLTRRNGAGQWAIEAVSSVYCDSGGAVDLVFDGLGNPTILFNQRLGDVEGETSDQRAWLARWSGTDWLEEPLTAPQDGTVVGRALLFDAWRGDFIVDADELQLMRICERTGAGGWLCEEPFLGFHHEAAVIGEETTQSGALGSGLLAQDDFGELFLAFTTESQYDVSLARRQPGATEWVLEHVDHFATKGPVDELSEEQGPYLALDPTGLPTLSWLWNDVTYFAWKAP